MAASSWPWDRFCRLVGCDSDSDRDIGVDEVDEVVEDEDREAFFKAAAAARAAWETGT